MKKRHLEATSITCGANAAVHTWEMTNLNDDLNSWMSAVKRLTNCPVLLPSKKATSCLKQMKWGRFFFHVSVAHRCASQYDSSLWLNHSPSDVQLLLDLNVNFAAKVRDYTWEEMQRGFFSCLPPLSHPPGKARWCSHWSAGPAQMEARQ